MYDEILSTITFFESYVVQNEDKLKSQEKWQRLIEEMNEEIAREVENTERQVRLEEQHSTMRRLQLEKTCFTWGEKRRIYEDYVLQQQEEKDWLQYLLCDGLPNPKVLSNLTTFMYFWSLEDFSIDSVTEKCQIVVHIIESLDDMRNLFGVSKKNIEDCNFIKQQLREKLQLTLDSATYYLLRNIESNMTQEDLQNARYFVTSDRFSCCIWAQIQLPIGLKNVAEKDRVPIEVSFEEVDVSIKFPSDVDCYDMAIRILHLTYDHFSDQSSSFSSPDAPEEFRIEKDLLTYCSKEDVTIREIRLNQSEKRRQIQGERRNIIEKIMKPSTPSPEETFSADASKKSSKKKKKVKRVKSKNDPNVRAKKKMDFERELQLLPTLPPLDEIILQKQDEYNKKRNTLLLVECKKFEINLRKYVVLGGVFHINLVYQPPQPRYLENGGFMTTLRLPENLRHIPFYKPYDAPTPAPEYERTPEVIEAEIKALEAAMEKLALITLKLPESVLWLEPPLVAHWESEQRIWSTKHVHDIKYNEEKQQIAFRSGKFGVHALVASKFVNLPFQSWELKPEKVIKGKDTGVVLSLSAAIVQVEFIVRDDSVCLHSWTGAPATVFKDLIDSYMSLDSLIQKMRLHGCDLFPEEDAFNYVKGISQKHSITVKHSSECMALLSNAYNFSWSRWNSTRVSRQIVFRMKELHGFVAKQRSSETVLITPLEAKVVQCTEVNSEFNEQSVEGEENKFYADLYHLALRNAGIKTRLLIKNIPFKLAVTVAELLQRTNVISMSS